MNASAAIADLLLRRAFGRRARDAAQRFRDELTLTMRASQSFEEWEILYRPRIICSYYRWPEPFIHYRVLASRSIPYLQRNGQHRTHSDTIARIRPFVRLPIT